jgi:hypothetical protein
MRTYREPEFITRPVHAAKGKHGLETELEKCATRCSGVRDFSGMSKYT